MAFCTNCGTKLTEGAKFCPNCGAQLAVLTTPAPAPEVQPQPVVQPEPQVQQYQPPVQEYEQFVQEEKPQVQQYQQPVQQYQPPVQEYKQPVQEEKPQVQQYQQPVQQYQPPVQEYKQPAQENQDSMTDGPVVTGNFVMPEAAAGGKASGGKNKSLIIIIAAAVLAVIGIIVLIVALGGGKEKKALYGVYEIVSESAYGENCDTQGEWVELKKHGKGTYYSGYEFKLKWDVDENEFDGEVTFLGIKEEMEGTIEDGVLAVDYGDYSMVFLKQGMELPEKYKISKPSKDDNKVDIATSTDDSGYYYIYSMEANGTTVDYSTLEMGEMTDAYLWLISDGTGEIRLASSDKDEEITWEDGIIHYNGHDLTYTRDGDTITVIFTDQLTMTYSLNLPGADSWDDESWDYDYDTESIDYETMALYEGDWHGMIEFGSCSGIHENSEGAYTEMIARFSFDENGNLIPYLRCNLTNDESDNFQLNDNCYYDSFFGSITLDGTFVGVSFDEPLELYYDSYNNSISFYLTVTDGEDGLTIYGSLRRLDDDWSQETYVYVPDNFYEAYKDWTLEEIAARYDSIDVSLIPERTFVSENHLG